MPSGFWVDSSLWQSKHYKAELIHSCISVLSTWKHYRDKKHHTGLFCNPRTRLPEDFSLVCWSAKGYTGTPKGNKQKKSTFT